MNNSFKSYIQHYFTVYLPITRNLSYNTISTYKNCFIVFLEFLKIEKINADTLTLDEINFELIEKFIDYLKNVRNNKSPSINTKLATLKSFFTYLQTRNLNVIELSSLINNIKNLKCEKNIPDYLSTEEIEKMFKEINLAEKDALKHLCILTLLYDTGIRVSELCNLKVGDIEFSNDGYAIMTVIKGKGEKTRKVPISPKVKNIIKKYIKFYNLDDDEYLFKNRYNNKYTSHGIRHILNKYFNKAKNKSDNTLYQCKCHPHMLRHSKAMHLLEAGTDLIVIRDFLGHETIESTQIYARISQEKQREIVLRNSKDLTPKIKRTKKEKDDLENWLRNNIQ